MSVWSRYWWVCVFCGLTCLVYCHSLKEKKNILRRLSLRLEAMEKDKWLAVQKWEELGLRIASQQDPAWIEMILMRDLGVVPEGFLKVHFINPR